jgi:hypothetical protein
MPRSVLTSVLIFCSALIFSCAKKDTAASTGAMAAIQLRDGTSFSGTVTATSPQQMTLTVDGGSRTVEMKDVKSVEYLDAPAPAPPAVAAPTQPVPPAQLPPTQPRYHPPATAITTKTYLLPVGTQIMIRTDETIDSGKAADGQVYAAEVARDVQDAVGDLVIPRGSNAKIVVRSATKGGRIRGQGDLVLDLRSVSIDGREYLLDTEDFVERGQAGVGKNKRTGEFVAGGAIVGTIIGAIAGHGKGAAIGAASGAGAGVGTEILTHGRSVKVPAEALITFRLDKSLSVYAPN